MVISRINLLLLVIASGKQCSGYGINAGQVYYNYSSVVASFFDENELHTLAIDKNDGTIYIGGTNKIFQIKEDLKNYGLKEKSVGPHLDHPDCPTRKNCKLDNPKLTDNVNKLLILDHERSQVVACGTLYQGSCLTFKLGNVLNITREVEEAVTVNNDTLSTVAFIAPGPAQNPEGQVLYIGTQYSGDSIYRQDVPAVASRYLETDNFLRIPSEIASSSSMRFNNLYRDNYPITYVHGFTSGKFSYFVTRQRKSTSPGSPLISRLVRICLNDPSYSSYTEIDLTCQNNGQNYNLVQDAYVAPAGTDLSADMGIQVTDDVLYAVFSPSKLTDGDLPLEKGALCIYSLSHINEIFTSNLKKCFAGEGNLGLEFIRRSLPCLRIPSIKIDDEFCGMEVNSPLSGQIPVESEALLTYPTVLTSVAGIAQESKTVVYIGTAHGNLKTVLVENTTSASEDIDVVVDSGASVKDIQFGKNKDHLYLLSTNKVSKVKITPCAIYNSCEECHGIRDSHCGWCLSEPKCSLREDCPDATKYLHYWGDHRSKQCTKPYFSRVVPEAIPWNTVTWVYMYPYTPPPVKDQYECLFKFLGQSIVTPIDGVASVIICDSPKIESFPEVPSNEDHFSAEVWLREKNGSEIASSKITFYDCNRHTSCSECTSSNFVCYWCATENKCTADAYKNCPNDNRISSISRNGPSSCPRISSIDKSEIIVSSGSEKSIVVRGENLLIPLDVSLLKCRFTSENTTTIVEARIVEDVIHCNVAEFTAFSSTSAYTVDVLWGNSNRLDNPENITVTAYDCNLSADNCGHCSLLPEEYQCEWSKTTGKCEITKDFSKLLRETTCPDVGILDFHPLSGPLEGGTDITIRGVNLGFKVEDISDCITVAGVKCVPLNESYIPSEEVKCRISNQELNDPRNGPIIVEVNNQHQGESTVNYVFVDPQISDLSPTSGPVSGGTIIYISGTHLDAGSRIIASIAGQPCEILSRNRTVAICITGSAQNIGEGKLVMNFDNGLRELATTKFKYVEDPIITNVMSGRPGSGRFRTGPRGIPSGGKIITVEGKGFSVIRHPKIYAVYRNQEFNDTCTVKTDTQMECRSPSIPVPVSSFPSEQDYMELDYGFLMDDVEGVRNLPKRKPSIFNPLRLFQDPVFHPFRSLNGVKIRKSEYLIINGDHIDTREDPPDFVVHIGEDFCNVTSFSRSQISCLLPDVQPLPLDRSNDLPEVVVSVGEILKYEIGYMKYDARDIKV